VLYAQFYHTLMDNPQYDYADFVQVQETNTRMVQELQALGVRPYKRHRIYQRAVG
jgi:hypothetical protein